MSRHSPIMVKLNLCALPKKTKSQQRHQSKPALYKALSDDLNFYKAQLQENLEVFDLPQSPHCDDPHCTKNIHASDRDSHVLDVLGAVIESSHLAIPLSGGRKRPGGPSGPSEVSG